MTITEKVAYLTEKYNMDVCVTHTSFDRMLTDLDSVMKEHKMMGCDTLGIGGMPDKYKGSVEGIDGGLNVSTGGLHCRGVCIGACAGVIAAATGNQRQHHGHRQKQCKYSFHKGFPFCIIFGNALILDSVRHINIDLRRFVGGLLSCPLSIPAP